MVSYSPAQWAAMQQTIARVTAGMSTPQISVDDRCVNEGARRTDGTTCAAKAEASGWCEQCADELFPPGWESRRTAAS